MTCNTTNNRRQINFCFFDEVTAHICAGPDKQKFLFHKSVLCQSAPFFTAALEGGFKEAGDAVIDMPSEKPCVIQRFRLWAYTGQVLEAAESIKDTSWDTIIWLYIFADKYDLPDLQNATIDTMIAKWSVVALVPSQHLSIIYDNTDAASPLRRLMIDWMAQTVNLVNTITEENLDQNLEKFPPIFLLDLALALYKLKKGITKAHSWYEMGCTFHTHPSVSTEKKQDSPSIFTRAHTHASASTEKKQDSPFKFTRA